MRGAGGLGVAFGAGEELQGKGVNIEGALAALPPTRLAWPAEPAAGVWLGSGEHIGKGAFGEGLRADMQGGKAEEATVAERFGARVGALEGGDIGEGPLASRKLAGSIVGGVKGGEGIGPDGEGQT